jgi:hypothetical protein
MMPYWFAASSVRYSSSLDPAYSPPRLGPCCYHGTGPSVVEELTSTLPQLSLVVCGGDSRAEGNDSHLAASEKEWNDSSQEGGHLIWKNFVKHDGDKDGDNI